MNLHRLSKPLIPSLLLASAGVLFVACADSNYKSSDRGDSDSTTGTNSGGGEGGAGGATVGAGGAGGGGGAPVVPPMMKTISGDVTWNIDFDATAEAAGATDCVYTRHYEGAEDRSAPWLCPSCEIMFRADVEMTVGQADCFTQVSTTPPAAAEWIGYGGGTWWRAVDGPTTEQGMVTTTVTDVSLTHAVPDLDATVGGKMAFAITGALKLGEQDGDPLHGWIPPATYMCGWPKADPAPYTGDYTMVKGKPVPDGLFRDACGEVVRLHDFKGSYLVIDMSAMDCPPCQSMATDEEQFITDMKAQGINVFMITLLAPSLSDPLGTTTKGNLNTWINNFTLTSPVIGDRGWGLSMFVPLFADQTGYPSLVIVDPDLNVVDFQSGFGGFADIQTTIVNDSKP